HVVVHVDVATAGLVEQVDALAADDVQGLVVEQRRAGSQRLLAAGGKRRRIHSGPLLHWVGSWTLSRRTNARQAGIPARKRTTASYGAARAEVLCRLHRPSKLAIAEVDPGPYEADNLQCDIDVQAALRRRPGVRVVTLAESMVLTS